MTTIKELYTIYLQHNNISTDTRAIQSGDLFFALKGDNFNGNKFAANAIEKGASYAVIDEETYHNVNNKTILVPNVLETLQELARYHREQLNIPIIALTGSNGKTTSKELINAVLSKKYNTTATKGNLNNHIGVPLTLLTMNSETEIGIVEMGANHHKEIAFLSSIAQPDYGYITNFGKAHLEGFGSLEGVVKAKSELYDFLRANNKSVFLNIDNQKQVKQAQNITAYTFSTNQHSDTTIALKELSPMVHVTYKEYLIKTNLIGSYNFTNIAASICIGNHFKVNDSHIKEALEGYYPTNNRSQIIQKGNNNIILDAYNANPTSMQAALENIKLLKDPNKIIIIGDMFELGATSEFEHQNIVLLLEKMELDQAYIVGEHFFKTNYSSKISGHQTFESFAKKFKKPENSTILIKGSRGMKLERVLDLL